MKKFIISAVLLIAVLVATPSQAKTFTVSGGSTGCLAGIGDQMTGQCGGVQPAAKVEHHRRHHHAWHFHHFHHFHHAHFHHFSHHSHSHHHHHHH